MKLMQKSALAAAVAAASVAVTAAEQTGTLTVTTTIAASCEAPSPAGNLVLPFDNSAPLTSNGQAVSSALAVTVTCSGNPTIQDVAFDSGSAGPGSGNRSSHRLMQRSGTNGTAEAHFLGYKLYAGGDSSFSANSTNLIDVGGAATLSLDDQGSSTFYVRGRVFEGGVDVWADGAAVVGGTYTDTVTMTINY